MGQQSLIKPNYKKIDNEQDKPFFASYLNTAKQNAFIILQDISENIGLSFDFNNDQNMMNENAGLWTYLKDSGNKEPEITGRIIQKIEQYFPFSNIMALVHAKSKKKTKITKCFNFQTRLKIA
jgi:hypothetical protein